jgi:hypothetical protein
MFEGGNYVGCGWGMATDVIPMVSAFLFSGCSLAPIIGRRSFGLADRIMKAFAHSTPVQSFLIATYCAQAVFIHLECRHVP